MEAKPGEPSQAAMERAREVAPPCAKCFGRGRVPKWQCLPMKCGACKGTGKDSKVVKAVALAIDLHAAAAVQEERERLDRSNALLTRAVDRLARLQRMDTPWPLTSVLQRLVGAAEHLLQAHGCDHRAWEEASAAVAAGREAYMLMVRELYESGSAEDGEGKAQNPNPSQQPTTGTGGEP